MPSQTHTEPPAADSAPNPRPRFLCRHVFTDGHRCGSPSLRGEHLCYYHTRSRRQGPSAGRAGTFVLPRIDDHDGVQIALYDVLSRMAAGDIELKRGSSLLYGLQIASSNLGRRQPLLHQQPSQVEDVTDDYHLGDLAPIAEYREPVPSASVILTEARSAQPKDPEVAAVAPSAGSTLPPLCVPPTPAATPDPVMPILNSALLPPTSREILKRREPVYVHNSPHRDIGLYPAIRSEIVFSPTPEEFAEALASIAPESLPPAADELHPFTLAAAQASAAPSSHVS